MVPNLVEILFSGINTTSEIFIEIPVCGMYDFSAQLVLNLQVCGWENVIEYDISGTCLPEDLRISPTQSTTDLSVNMMENTDCTTNLMLTNGCMESRSVTARLFCTGKF